MQNNLRKRCHDAASVEEWESATAENRRVCWMLPLSTARRRTAEVRDACHELEEEAREARRCHRRLARIRRPYDTKAASSTKLPASGCKTLVLKSVDRHSNSTAHALGLALTSHEHSCSTSNLSPHRSFATTDWHERITLGSARTWTLSVSCSGCTGDFASGIHLRYHTETRRQMMVWSVN